jgi:hypothetical protein
MELDLQSLFGLLCTAVLSLAEAQQLPTLLAFGLTRGRQDRRHLFVSPWSIPFFFPRLPKETTESLFLFFSSWGGSPLSPAQFGLRRQYHVNRSKSGFCRACGQRGKMRELTYSVDNQQFEGLSLESVANGMVWLILCTLYTVRRTYTVQYITPMIIPFYQGGGEGGWREWEFL